MLSIHEYMTLNRLFFLNEAKTLNRRAESFPGIFFLCSACSTKMFRRLFSNIIGLPERRNKRKSVLEIKKMYYFKI